MRSMSAYEAKARFGQLLDAARSGPVTIKKHGREVAVLISKQEFDAMQQLKLRALKAEVQKGLDDIEAGRYTELEVSALDGFGESIKARGRKNTTG